MAVKFIDRRSEATESGEATSDHSSRLKKRITIKRQMSAARYAEWLHDRLVRKIESINLEKMRFADKHGEACGPLRAESADIDKRQVERFIANHDPCESLAARRDVIGAAIEHENEVLKTLIEAADKRLVTLEAERRELAKMSNWQQYENDLLALADPQLYAKMRRLQRQGRPSLSGETAESVYREIIAE